MVCDDWGAHAPSRAAGGALAGRFLKLKFKFRGEARALPGESRRE